MGPSLCGLAATWLLIGLSHVVAGLLFTVAGMVVVAVYVATLRHRFEWYLGLMAGGAVL